MRCVCRYFLPVCGLSSYSLDSAFCREVFLIWGFPGGSDGKASACNTGDPSLIPGLGRSLGEGNGNPLQYSCQENPMVRGAWYVIVHGVTKSWTWLSDFTLHFLILMKSSLSVIFNGLFLWISKKSSHTNVI